MVCVPCFYYPFRVVLPLYYFICIVGLPVFYTSKSFYRINQYGKKNIIIITVINMMIPDECSLFFGKNPFSYNAVYFLGRTLSRICGKSPFSYEIIFSYNAVYILGRTLSRIMQFIFWEEPFLVCVGRALSRMK